MTGAVDLTDKAQASHSRILASTALIGCASVLNVLIGVIRMKLAAVLLGPSGLGLIGLFTTVMNLSATVAQLGMTTVGTRQIAEAHATGQAERLAINSRALTMAAIVLAAAGALVVWTMRAPLARWIFGEDATAAEVGLIAVGVGLAVVATAQSAIIRGLQRMRDLALISVLGALVTTVAGVSLLWAFGPQAIPAFVIMGPLAAFLLGGWFLRRSPTPSLPTPINFNDLRDQWLMFLRLGVPFMGASIATIGAELIIRIDVKAQLGLVSLGHFQASWTIAATYVGFVIGAMGADYYPRLTGAMSQPIEAVALVNQQTEVSLLLSGVVILAMIGFAPLLITVMFSSAFADAGDMLRWQALATVLKVISWPLGYVLLSAGAGRVYFLVETGTLAITIALVHLLLPTLSLSGAGVASLASYVVYVPLVYWFARRRIGFSWQAGTLRTMALASVLALGLFIVIAARPDWAHAATGLCIALYSLYALRRLHEVGLTSAVRRGLARLSGARNP